MSLAEMMCPPCRDVGNDRISNFKPEMLELEAAIGKDEIEETEVNPMWVGKNF
jgi:hypothetical protein